MVTVLNDVILPEDVIAAGVRGRNVRVNTRTSNQGGFMQVNIVAGTLRRYELGFIPMFASQWQQIEGLHEVTEGGAYGFLMRDPKDSNVAAAEGLLQPYTTANVGALGLGYGVPVHRLYKRYSVTGSARTKSRRIGRPRAAAITRGGVPVAVGAGAGQIALNSDTGTVTFVADTSQALASVTAGASTVLNFANGTGMVAAMAVGQRVYLAGLTGTAAAVLNGLSHLVTAKGATSLTVSTATTGLAAAAGTAYKYPQASEALAWSGSFYVPVQFENDEIDWEVLASGPEASRVLAGPSVMLVEVREP